jgi:epoxyqueuosine reductase
VLERACAREAGLGWVGKNGNLINKNAGSFYFIATLITDLVLVPDNPFIKDYCGTCNRCVESCPTAAILPEKVIDGSRCISYYTIELKSHLKPTLEKGYLAVIPVRMFAPGIGLASLTQPINLNPYLSY